MFVVYTLVELAGQMLKAFEARSVHTRLLSSKLYSRTQSAMSTLSASSSEPSHSCSMPSPNAAIDFLMLLSKLKTTKRTGWVKCNVQLPESIADHMYRMGVMSLLASHCGVDSGRCMRMALVHDIAEAIVGDITPHCNVSHAEKHRLEADAVQQIKQMLGPNTQAALEVETLWHDYEAQTTPESHLVKDFDKLEMIIQAHEYEQAQGLQLQQFFDTTKDKFKTQTGQAWAQELVARRQKAAVAPTTAAGEGSTAPAALQQAAAASQAGS